MQTRGSGMRMCLCVFALRPNQQSKPVEELGAGPEPCSASTDEAEE